MTIKAVEKCKLFAEAIRPFKEQDAIDIKACVEAESYKESNIAKSWIQGHPEVISHWPPQVLVGKTTNDEKTLLASYDDQYVRVEIFEVSCEYMYGNPTGVFNLSLAEKLMRTKNYTFISYAQFKEYQSK